MRLEHDMQRNSGSMQPMLRNGQIIAGKETYILQSLTTGEENSTFMRMKSNSSNY